MHVLEKNMMPYNDVSTFLKSIEDQYDELSKQLKTVARQIINHSDLIALNGITVLAERFEVAPSAIVRFAQTFGFSGFSQMQQLFRLGLADQTDDGDYVKRIQAMIPKHSNQEEPDLLLGSTVDSGIASLQALLQSAIQDALSDATDVIENAHAIWLVACGRSFPVASYLNYMFQHSDKPVHWVNGLGFAQHDIAHAMKENDVLIVISYAPYAAVSEEMVSGAVSKKAKVIAITDSTLSHIAKNADVLIQVQEQQTLGFRSLVSSMCVAQTLFLMLAYRERLQYKSDKK